MKAIAISKNSRPRAVVTAIALIAVTLTSTDAESGGYCRDYRPSISYMKVELPAALHGTRRPSPLDGIADNSDIMQLARANAPASVDFKPEAVKYAAIASFIEQLPIAVLGKDDPFLKSLHVRSAEQSVRDVMGFGAKGSRLIEPGDVLPDYSEIDLEIIDDDDTKAFADSLSKIRIYRGLVERIVTNAVNRTYGSPAGYRLHLKEILALTEPARGLLVVRSPTDMSLYVSYEVNDNELTHFPLGQVIENANAEGKVENPFYKSRKFAQEVVGELVFIGAHEVGHIKNGHRTGKSIGCKRFAEQERQADAYAAGVLAEFQFNMADYRNYDAPLNDWKSFFAFYRDSGLTTTDATTGCNYDSPEKRTAWVERAYQVAWDQLAETTFSSVDITTPNPTDVICSDGMTTWRQSLE